VNIGDCCAGLSEPTTPIELVREVEPLVRLNVANRPWQAR
jgi:hypothetical protein